MDDGIPTQLPRHSEAPSLAERLTALVRSTPSLRPWRPLGFAPLGLFAGSAATLAIWAWISSSEWQQRTDLLRSDIATAGMQREQQNSVATLFAAPSVDAALLVLRQNLPADLRLISAAGESGRLTITIEANDPDALRRVIRGEPWFAGFRERGQSMGREGSIRVTFERAG